MDSFKHQPTIRAAWLKLAIVFAGALLAVSANATPLFSVSSALASTDPTQLGRISRDGVLSDWSAPKVFPGVINPAVSYHYHVYDIYVYNATFIQVSFDEASPNIFASAYLNSYNPALGLATNYLGDAGTSADFFGTDPLFFQVQIPAYSHLQLVINETTPNGGLLAPFNLLVEGFLDSEFTDVPEPGTLSLAFAALIGFAFVRRKSLRAALTNNLSA